MPNPQADSAPAPLKVPALRCRLSVLFCDLCDSTALSGELEADEYADLLEALHQAYDTAVARHGGTVVRVQGDGMLAVFGHPLPREGDARRAVETALMLHETVRQLPRLVTFGNPRGAPRGDLRLHSGIHAGLVLVREGNLLIGRLELVGVVPNIAARLSAAAGRDEVLVSDETLGPARSHFDTGKQRLVRVPSHELPLLCWPVTGRARGAADAARHAVNAHRGVFVGRRAELLRLEDRLGDVLNGDTRQVALVGPPGVGKTRLATEFAQIAESRGCRVLKGYCDAELDAVPMQPLLQMLRSAFAIERDVPIVTGLARVGAALELLGIDNLMASLLPLLGRAEGTVPAAAGSPAAAPATAAAPTTAGTTATTATTSAATTTATTTTTAADPLLALARLFATWAERQPLLLFIDDWHWADAASRHALAAICAAGEGSGLMVVVSARSIDEGDATMRQVEVMPIEPFTPAEGRESIRSLLPQADPFVAEDIYARSGGNALFIEELCHSATHGPQQRLAGQPVGAAWLQELIESRVARLPAREAQFVRTLAVLGNIVPNWLMTAMTGVAADDPLLQELAAKDLIFAAEGGTLRFKHGRAHEVIYQSVGRDVRQPLHLRIAQTLSQQAGAGSEVPHEALAYHYGAAGHTAEAADHAERAGDRAAALSALDRAKRLYHAALMRLQNTEAPLDGERLQRWLAIANKLGVICVFDAARDDLPLFELAVRLADTQPEPALRARARYWLGYVLYALGQARDAVAHCEQAAALAGAGGDALAVQIRATLGQAKAAAGDYTGAEPLLRDAVAIKRSHRRSTRASVGLAFSLVCLASVVGDRGDFARAHELFDEAWSLVNGEAHEMGASITGWRAVMYGWQGRWAEAAAAADTSTRIAEQTHSLFQFCQGRATGAYAKWMQSGEAQWIDVLAESTLWLEPRDSGLYRSLDHGWLAEAWLARGERANARLHAARALRRARAGDLIGVALGCRAWARDAAAADAPGRAARWLERAQRIAAARESRHEAAANELCLAEVAFAAGAHESARRAANTALSAFEGLQMTWHAERARALLSRAAAG
jgi:class 3 adenylate cyclase/tetratricopeptide (TPR) repeat protein